MSFEDAKRVIEQYIGKISVRCGMGVWVNDEGPTYTTRTRAFAHHARRRTSVVRSFSQYRPSPPYRNEDRNRSRMLMEGVDRAIQTPFNSSEGDIDEFIRQWEKQWEEDLGVDQQVVEEVPPEVR